ncbi:CubicO group peptidase, beta-lactamase class C family [Mucilaginibacter sp. OK268]|jgi:CubicO group peptidase (beta-lactamase class C family)|uniref:serine hydrolase domain-containing protein n=1 Tax=Mucilaginibacter sp. OK268 TaxID=1881048 RepID=UPI00088C2B6D|nr:serine hydrolase [Mucilaginibacter sp. OK268]SDP79209.1 CubicO group peptidase, beta-lactamase class C family [Mucilaginibacter sp. OK268]
MKRYILFILTFITVTTSSFAQTSNITQPELLTLPVYKGNVGKVVFLADTINLTRLKQTDLLNQFEARPQNNLYMRFFIANSLTNYQHQLNSSLSVEDSNKGNFQFTFYVDGRQIYQENLNKGANLPATKNTKTTISVPLISNRNEDSWGRGLWYRFTARGGDDALITGEHLLKIEVRPYINIPDLKVGEIIAQGGLRFTVPPPDTRAVQVQAIKPNSGWQVSSELFDQNKIMAMNGLIAQNKLKDITSIVVIKNGKLLIEEYFNGSSRDSLHDPRSVGKTFASAMMGIAIHDGFIKSENQTLKDFYDLKKFNNYSPRKEGITLKSLLTMSSIFDGDDNDSDSPGNEENMYPTPDWAKFTLDLRVDSAKTGGKQWNYFTAGAMLLGDMVNKSVPGGLEKYADEKLFKPLGIVKYQWPYSPQHVPSTAGGLQMRSLDYAKFGQLYKNNGAWNGKQIIPESWVKQSFTKYLTLPKDVVGEGCYGYLFWNKTYTVNDKSYETFYCSGNGGNKIFVFTDVPLVVIVTATAYGKPYAHPQVDKIMQEYILPAVLK